MRLLFITQKIDERDGPLGFVHGWVKAFASRYEKVTVICLEQGASTLPEATAVLSLGKETHRSRLQYVVRFYKYIVRLRRDYDVVLVHMNQEYVLLGAILWKMLGKRVGFWYNHTHGGFRTKVAMMLSDVVFHTSPYAFTACASHSRRMPAGIDVEQFVDEDSNRDETEVLFIGRIAPIKGLHVLAKAVGLLSHDTPLHLTVYGAALPEDAQYAAGILSEAPSRSLFNPAVPNVQTPPLYRKAGIFVNLTPAGNYDKTVLEAMACGALPVVSSPAFNDAVPGDSRFVENNPASLASALEAIYRLPAEEKASRRRKNRAYVCERHSLEVLTEALEHNLMRL